MGIRVRTVHWRNREGGGRAVGAQGVGLGAHHPPHQTCGLQTLSATSTRGVDWGRHTTLIHTITPHLRAPLQLASTNEQVMQFTKI